MKAVSVIAITSEENRRIASVSVAAKEYGVSSYRILKCCFQCVPIDNDVFFDFATDVSDDDEKRIYASWHNARQTSQRRMRRFKWAHK
ncbi:MAG: hypothetical protein IJS84_08250 [Spirochaetales bacterium]|nr:hypothetical protein [Spirochaetales bacterium]MBQ7645000.1 hypothetical protein [Spirochaetales bacterium]